jgi:hypothetical protein
MTARMALLVALVGVPPAYADGCKWLRDGRVVPEHEQQALIEWADGAETLYVAVRTDVPSGESVWIVPVRAAATTVKAEPIDEFPVVPHYMPLAARAKRKLETAIAIAGSLDSGGMLCLLLMPGCAGEPRPTVEESRVEKLGMVVTVVSANSRAALESYLDGQGVNRSAADLWSLDPYFGQPGFAFVCGWTARAGAPAAATGLKITFASPTIWFPLRPTRVYTNPVETVVFVRGFARPAPGCDLPGLTCQYVEGPVVNQGVVQAFAATERDYHSLRYGFPDSQRLTRVTLSTNAQLWDRDLELVEGTTTAGAVALAVVEARDPQFVLVSALIAGPLGLFVPWRTVQRGDRRWFDWLTGVLIGAAIVFSLWASAIVFGIWYNARFRRLQARPYAVLSLALLAVCHFAAVFAVCRGLMAWIDSGS